jgi:hypothetical protein
LGGLVAGTVDIASACLLNLRSPIVILHAIASGVLGPASFRGGAASAALGLGLQWFIGLIIAGIYSLAVDRVRNLRSSWVTGGLVAGVASFGVMNYVVLPLSAVGRIPHFTAATFIGNLAAILLFGLIIAFFARKAGADPA